jgi:phosphate acetyltransferase
MDPIIALKAKAQKKCPTIVFPEGTEPKIIEAAARLAEEKVIKPVILGNAEAISAFGTDTSRLTIIDYLNEKEKMEKWSAEYEPLLDMPARMVMRQLRKPLNYGAAMVHFGEVDGMVGGLTYSTGDVVLSANMYIGLGKDVKAASSYFLMDVPNWKGGEDGLIIYADGGVVPNPDPEELASIAMTTADSAVRLLGWEPRVAMLSFSTKGSAKHPDVTKVVTAFNIVKEKRPELKVDGELQGDAALDEGVAAKKAGADNVLKGKANILIFPDLDAGNIAYKLTQRLTGGKAYGPLLQGFAKPVSDLSRGSSVDDIMGVAIIVAAQV